jgi:hypothetical protein
LSLVSCLGAGGCGRSGDALGDVVLDGTEEGGTTIAVGPGQELFFHIEGEGIGSLGDHRGRYVLRVELLRDGESVATLSCDPLHHGLSGAGSSDDNDVEFSGDIQDCVVRPAPTGELEVRARLGVPGMTDIGIDRATLTVYGAPLRDADARVRFWEGGEMTMAEKLAAFAIFVVFLGLGVALVHRRSRRNKAARQRIRTLGIRGDAKVLRLRDTGGSVNDNPKVEVELEITLDDHGSYRAPPRYRTTQRLYISTLAIPRVQPGCVVEVLVDPRDHDRLVLKDPDIEYDPW